MKIEKLVCDRCGAEATPVPWEYRIVRNLRWEPSTINTGGFMDSNLDLCDKCREEFKEWFKNTKEETGNGVRVEGL